MSTTRGELLTNLETLRRRAREHIDEGALTRGYQADLDTVLRLLNETLATRIVCVLRYRRHDRVANGIHAPGRGRRVPGTRQRGAEEVHAKDLVDLLATLDPTRPA